MSETVVRFKDAWTLWAVWVSMDILMAAFGKYLPDWATWDVHRAMSGDFYQAFLIFWLWLVYRKTIPAASSTLASNHRAGEK